MSTGFGERVLIATGVAYLLVLAWCTNNVSYDIWGALVVIPPLAIVGFIGIRRMFAGADELLARLMLLGLAAKLVGVVARYWVSFDAYGGATDAQRYHAFAKVAAGRVWSGADSPLAVIPYGSGTAFMERFTELIYTLIGSSRLAFHAG